MKTRNLLMLLLLILGVFPARTEPGGAYSSLSGLFSPFADPNTGLTVFPTLEVPMGGRYEGMGTAYAAVSSDSGYMESNPSGSAQLEYTELSFLHHAWIADSNLEGVVYTARFDDLGIGVGGKFLYVPFTAYNEWGERSGKGFIAETIATLNVSYNFFSSYNFYGLAVGSNLKVAYRSIPSSIYSGQSALAYMVDVGLLTRFNLLKYYLSRSRNFSIGLVARNIGPPVMEEPLPTVATAGIAYTPIRPLTLAVDFNLPFTLDPAYPAERWDIAAGMDLAVAPFLSVQGGVRLKGDNPRISVGSTIDTRDISFTLNYNLDLSGRLNPLDKFSVEAKLNLGDHGRQARRDQVEDLYLSGLESYARGEIGEAVRMWRAALDVDPGFLPASSMLETAMQDLSLQEQIQRQLQLDSRY